MNKSASEAKNRKNAKNSIMNKISKRNIQARKQSYMASRTQEANQSKAKDNIVIPDPIDEIKFQPSKGSGKSGIRLGIT